MWSIDSGYSGDPVHRRRSTPVALLEFGDDPADAEEPRPPRLPQPARRRRPNDHRGPDRPARRHRDRRSPTPGAEGSPFRRRPRASSGSGDFATALAYAARLHVGASPKARTGPLVDRLATQLAGFAGEPAPPPRQTMDATLLAKVVRFQTANGLSRGRQGRADDLHAAQPRDRRRRAAARRDAPEADARTARHVVHPRCPAPRRRRARARHGAQPAHRSSSARCPSDDEAPPRPRSLIGTIVALAGCGARGCSPGISSAARLGARRRRVDHDAGAGPVAAASACARAADRDRARHDAGVGAQRPPRQRACAGAAADASAAPGRGGAADSENRRRCAPRAGGAGGAGARRGDADGRSPAPPRRRPPSRASIQPGRAARGDPARAAQARLSAAAATAATRRAGWC